MSNHKLEIKYKTSNKKQGQNADGKHKASDGKKRAPRQEDNGIGSAYAIAVGEALNLEKGSKQGFLGKEKKTIDPKQFAGSTLKKENK